MNVNEQGAVVSTPFKYKYFTRREDGYHVCINRAQIYSEIWVVFLDPRFHNTFGYNLGRAHIYGQKLSYQGLGVSKHEKHISLPQVRNISR